MQKSCPKNRAGDCIIFCRDKTLEISVESVNLTSVYYPDDAVLFTDDMNQWENLLPSFESSANTMGALHELNQMVNLRVNHLVKCRCVARDPNLS